MMTHDQRRARAQAVIDMAKAGKTDREIALAVGLSAWSVVKYRLRGEVQRPKNVALNVERGEEMRKLFEQGVTLAAIGERYSLTRERVRQILQRRFGLTARDGGFTISKVERTAARAQRVAASRAEIAERKRHQYLHTLRCTPVEYELLTGDAYCPEALHFRRYKAQRYTAAQRGIGFDLTFPEWWAIWQESGHYHERRTGGYVMARHGDIGPYAIGNVRICTTAENVREALLNRPRSVTCATGLTENQAAVLAHMRDRCAANDAAPTMGDMCKHFGWKSNTSGWQFIEALERKGHLTRRREGKRVLFDLVDPVGAAA